MKNRLPPGSTGLPGGNRVGVCRIDTSCGRSVGELFKDVAKKLFANSVRLLVLDRPVRFHDPPAQAVVVVALGFFEPAGQWWNPIAALVLVDPRLVACPVGVAPFGAVAPLDAHFTSRNSGHVLSFCHQINNLSIATVDRVYLWTGLAAHVVSGFLAPAVHLVGHVSD